MSDKKNARSRASKAERRAPTAKPTTEDASAKTRLLEAGAKLFAERGLEGTSVRDLAAEAGLNLSLVSYYFGGKEGLYKELLRNFAVNVRDELESLLNLGSAEELTQESLERLFTGIVACLTDIRTKHTAMSLVMQRERLAGLPHGREIHDDIFGPLGLMLIGFIQKAQKKGLVKKELNPLLVFIFLQESLIGFHTLVHCDLKVTQTGLGTTKNFKDFQHQLVQIFVKGIFT
jgi:AcrR family transcriptional regulator